MSGASSRVLRGGEWDGWVTRAMRRTGGSVLLLALGACTGDRPARVLAPDAPGLAKGGGGGGGGAVSVTATSPTSAPQDTTLDVTISGSGFSKGARAAWSLDGDTSVVHVLSTKYVNSTTLVARIVVPGLAPTTTYDVEVQLSDGKKGVGAELFEVTVGDPTATFYVPLADATLAVKSDRQFTDGTHSLYANGICGVASKIFATTQYSNSGDATMQTNRPNTKDRNCTPRTMTVDFGDGVSTTGGVFMNVRAIANTTSSIAIGDTQARTLAIVESRCNGLRWVPVMLDGTVTGADMVLVTRLDLHTWRVRSQPYPANKAYCLDLGRLFHVSVDFTVRSSYPLS